MLVLNRAAARAIDAQATARYRMPSIMLMENASRAVAEAAMELAGWEPGARVLVVCGPGNNGGDGLGAARHLHNSGAEVCILLAADAGKTAGDAGVNLEICRAMELPIERVDASDPYASASRALERLGVADVVIDALFGTGLDRPAREAGEALIAWMNERHAAGVPVLAVDVPSGLDCDSGRPLGAAARADVTVTFCAIKRGFLELEAQEYVGEVEVADIGVPRELVESLGVVLDTRTPGADDSDGDEPPAPCPKPGDSAS